MSEDPYADLKRHRLTPEMMEKLAVVPVGTPKKTGRRQQQFVKVPWTWVVRLSGAAGQTYRVALCLLYLHWKNRGGEIKLANGLLLIEGVSRQAKWKALNELERRNLITIGRRRRRSPMIRVWA